VNKLNSTNAKFPHRASLSPVMDLIIEYFHNVFQELGSENKCMLKSLKRAVGGIIYCGRVWNLWWPIESRR